MPALVPSCCVTLDNVLCLSVPAAGQYKDNQRPRHKKPPENPHLPSLRGQGQGGRVSLYLPSWGLSCLPHGLNGLSLNQGGRCLTGHMLWLPQLWAASPASGVHRWVCVCTHVCSLEC